MRKDNYKFSMEKVLVTGTTGFIGSRLVDRLIEEKRNISILVRDRRKIKKRWKEFLAIYEGDIRNNNKIKALDKDIDIIFHLVAVNIHREPRTDEEIEYVYQVNVEGTRNILEAFKSRIQHFIFFSSISVYDGLNTDVSITEETEAKLNNVYGKSKLIAERMISEYGKKYGFMTTSLRLPFVYGPGNKGNIFKLIEKIDKRRFILVGKGENKRSGVYVDNVIDAALLLVKKEIADGKNYIVADNVNYSVKELYYTIARVLNKNKIPFNIPLWSGKLFAKIGDILGCVYKRPILFDSETLSKFTRQRCFCSEKIREEIGFIPRYNFYNTIYETIDWYKKNYT